VVKITLDSGEIIRCTDDHKWWTGRNDATHAPYAAAYAPGANLRGKRDRGSELYRVCPASLPDLTDEQKHLAGWLAGFFDGEGSATIQQRRTGESSILITFTQGADRNLVVCDKLEYALTQLGFAFGCNERINSSGTPMRTYWLKSGAELHKCRASRLTAYQKFIHIVKPVKWRDRIVDAVKTGRIYTSNERVVSIEPDGEEDVYGLETTTGNYVVWGIASSNSSQYQQSPEPRGGSIIKRDYWKMYDKTVYPNCEFILASLDTAYTTKESNDPSALTIWGIYREENETIINNVATKVQGNVKVILLYAWRRRLEFNDLVQQVIDTCTRDKRTVSGPRFKVDRVIVEAKASGISVAQELRRLCGFSGDFGVELIKLKGNQDKVARLHSVQHLFAEGMVYAPGYSETGMFRDFASMVVDEVAVFPHGSHDDLVDSTSMAMRYLRDNGFMVRGEEKELEDREEMVYSGRQLPLYPA
jgi:predicted phage terminase large subunit-like protein